MGVTALLSVPYQRLEPLQQPFTVPVIQYAPAVLPCSRLWSLLRSGAPTSIPTVFGTASFRTGFERDQIPVRFGTKQAQRRSTGMAKTPKADADEQATPSSASETTSTTNPKTDLQDGPASNTVKDPDQWTTGQETMTGAQASYLKTLCEEAGETFDPGLSKADASKRIDALQGATGRGRSH